MQPLRQADDSLQNHQFNRPADVASPPLFNCRHHGRLANCGFAVNRRQYKHRRVEVPAVREMKLILITCIRDIDSTLLEGDLIAALEANQYFGNKVGLLNAIESGKYPDVDNYLQRTSFIILDLPLVSYRDIKPIIDDQNFILIREGRVNTGRKWKIDFSNLELRARDSYYADDDTTPTKTRLQRVVEGRIRRDTLNAYNEITRPDITIDDIKVLR